MQFSVNKRKSGWVASFPSAVTGKRRQVQVSSYEEGLALIESEKAKHSRHPSPELQTTFNAAYHYEPITVLRKQLALFSAFDPQEQRGMYLHHLEIFLFIGENGKVSYRDVEDEFGISNAAASRTINSLCTFARHRKKAIGLVEIIRDPMEGRRYLAQLSSKGKQAYKLITSLG